MPSPLFSLFRAFSDLRCGSFQHPAFCLFLQCFMNSILQCLSNTHSLRDYCLHNSHRRDLNNNNRTNTALMEGKCADRISVCFSSEGTHPDHGNPPSLPITEFAKLIQTMWTSTTSDAVSPSEFKTQIQRYAPRFVGYK